MEGLAHVNWGAVAAIVAVFGLLVSIIVMLIRVGRWAQRIENRFEQLENGVGALLFIHRKELVELYMGGAPPAPSNPYTAEERDRLIDKLR